MRKKSEPANDEFTDVGASSTVATPEQGATKKVRTVRYWLCKGKPEEGAFQALKEFKSLRSVQGFADGISALPGFDKAGLFAVKGKVVPI
jgi:hypothetical protein